MKEKIMSEEGMRRKQRMDQSMWIVEYFHKGGDEEKDGVGHDEDDNESRS